MSIVNIAGYKFIGLDESTLEEWRTQLLMFCQQRSLLGSITLSPEGINLNLAGELEAIDQAESFITSFSEFADLSFKRSFSETVPFRRLRIKFRAELTPTNRPGDAENFDAKYVLPKQFKQWMDDWKQNKKKLTLIDTRNRFEKDIGTFDGAVDLDLVNFREFPEAIKQLDENLKKEPVVIFCTGGIRCEKAAPAMEAAGFEEVYQLHGGILDYFEECGDEHYDGSCFVFDHRETLDANLQAHPIEGDLPNG